MNKVVLVGAGGKMGCRITDNIKNSSTYQVSYLEVGQAGIERLQQRGISVSKPEEVLPQADMVIFAVPDIYIGKVAASIVPQMKSGSIGICLDPAAPLAGHLPKREDISYFVSHPAHPSVFNWEPDEKTHFDYFGGIAAKQAIVCALMQGPEEHYAIGESLAKAMYAPVFRSHRITVEQMGILEPAMSETFMSTLTKLMREGLDEVVRKGVPKEAAWDFFLGHLNIQLGVLFDQLPGAVFSDAAYKAMDIGRPLIVKEDWKQIFEPESVKQQIESITKS
ncbi:semialdehyde dehydrogenase [Rhodocytophaga rosea]|uniref:Semialdehyde dehydrogenase n=1 Tax=Rhodocytophaga rosea TaxID=2704465 RepID=A0A6C0GL07_9BACT|nr:phosphogluconate dehydrogenase C-terminal domain-containing protein [Rhodocytophaga rosea]QHT68726.1 semialdehyde dehydrogenase [Rhodocytophaga rosea]